ncbi:hypothetical protein COO60DRAFT_445827 [Scenedesmus sp. NREL 46B-D3]|nr:hypothetical protein COO60DRAFT_445827 [Scenedesmus sp. NREL 46B-D3]
MNTLEAQRVLAVLDDAVDSLRLVSFITSEVVAAADQLGGVLGQDVADSLQQHAAELVDLQPDFQPHQLLPTSSSLLRVLKKSPGIDEALTSLQCDRSSGMMQLLTYFEQHRAQLQQRLARSVEEDATERDTFAALAERRERAAAEKLQLEHKLKLQRLEMAKQMGALQAAHDAATAELQELRRSAAAGQAATYGEAAAVKAADEAAYAAEHAELAKQLEAMHLELVALRSGNREAAAAARKARKRAQQDCEAAIGEFDAEMYARHREHEHAATAYNELQEQIKTQTAEADALRAERLAHEEALRSAAEAKKRAELRRLRLEAAAYAIQNAWKVWRKKKAAEAKKAAGKGKGGKGAAGKAAGKGKK